MMPPRAMIWPTLLCVCTCFLAGLGCAFQKYAAPIDAARFPPPSKRSRGADTPWPLWAERMRIHPLSQFVTDRSTGKLLIEVRIEFFDGYEDTCKGVGLIRIDLHDAQPDDLASASATAPIVEWERDLWDMEINEIHFDEVTRTYLFRLDVDEDKLPLNAELRAYFSSGNGKRLYSTYRLRR